MSPDLRRFLWRLLLGAGLSEVAGELMFPQETPEQQMGWWLTFMVGTAAGGLVGAYDAALMHLNRHLMASQMDEIP